MSSARPAGEFEEYTVPAATWAVFPGQGTHLSLQDLERRIVTEWLPTSGYAYGSAPDVEVYLNPDPNSARYEVWIPVVKRGLTARSPLIKGASFARKRRLVFSKEHTKSKKSAEGTTFPPRPVV